MVFLVLVETLMSLNFLGLGAAFPAGMFAHRFGVHVCGFLSTSVSTICYLLIYDACLRPYLYATRVYLLAIYFFLAGKYNSKIPTIRATSFDDCHPGEDITSRRTIHAIHEKPLGQGS